MTAKLFFNAAFPTMQVVLDDDPKMKAMFANVKGVVQIGAKDAGGVEPFLSCHLVFNKGEFKVVQGPASEGTDGSADIELTFGTVAKMNTMFRGGAALPAIKGLGHLGLLIKVLQLLLSLMIMMPNKRPTDYVHQKLKVKMSLYMITRALSQYNKISKERPDIGDASMVEWCKRQPDRIYQFIIDAPQVVSTSSTTASPPSVVEPVETTQTTPPDIACYLRVAAGQTKSGHGVYTRRTPFVLFHFFSVEGAMKVLLKEVAFVAGVEQHCVEIVGSPEYAMYLNDYMSVLQGMLT
jgi:hypothetical protein